MAGSRFGSFKSEKGDSAASAAAGAGSAQRRDPYEVLGLGRAATDQEIKSAFRRMALKYHPDKNSDDPVASDVFQEVTFSYSILSDPDKRRQYDTSGFEAIESDSQELELDLSSLNTVNTMFAALFSKLGVPIKTTVSATILEEALNGSVMVSQLQLGNSVHRKVGSQGCRRSVVGCNLLVAERNGAAARRLPHSPCCKISYNLAGNFKRANKILTLDIEPVHIWDFSGQTTYILMNEWNQTPQEPRSSEQEIPLEVHIYDLPEPTANGADGKRDELALTMGSSIFSNDCIMDMDLDSSRGRSKQVGSGLTGLDNLGNTCFMNSAVQCLAHTSKLVDYFLGDYYKEINPHNPLGMKGELAYAFGDLLRKLWAFDRSPVAPRQFKAKLARFAPQFSGFNQHDSQELLAFLLDGLHEDLNRVKCKPYSEAKDADSRPDEEVADEYWGNHLARNDSIIVDICQGQYKSTLVCPICKKVSVTFDPFMYLSLPLPSTTMRTMTITVFSSDGTTGPSPYTVSVPKSGDTRTLIAALSNACLLRDDERLLVAEVYNSSIIRYLDEPSEVISLIRDGDRLVAYRLLKDSENAPIVVFRNQRMDFGRKTWKTFGTPLVSSLPDTVTGSTISNLFLKVLSPFRISKDDFSDADQTIGGSSLVNETTEVEMSCDASERTSINNNSLEDETMTEDGMQFYLINEKFTDQRLKIEMDQPVALKGLQKRLHVVVCWQGSGLEQYNFGSLDSLPEVSKAVLFARRPQDTCSLYACLEAFIKEEPLGPEDMWYCPGCKEHRQASKKLDLWRLPEILIIHLKRFSYSRFTKNKLETFVDFPIHDLDLSKYIGNRSLQIPHSYRLYAISNHYGSMGGGHYTAYVYHDGKTGWYDFDDRHVGPITEDSIKTSAAYVLFYRRIQNDSIDSTETEMDSDCPS